MATQEELFIKNLEEGIFENSSLDEELLDDSQKAIKEYVSLLIKALRLGKLEDAIYAVVMLLECGATSFYILRRLEIFTLEDCVDPQAVVLANAIVNQAIRKVPDWENGIYLLLVHLSKAPKFWESEDFRKCEEAYWRIVKDYRENGPREIPNYARDSRHTPSGYKASKEKNWGKVDNRFAGSEIGRLTMCRMFERYGRLSEEDSPNVYWEVFNETRKK